MFTKLFNKKLQVIAPITGKVIGLKDVPDPVFSEKMMGDGIAIVPEGGSVLSPVEGKVILTTETKHAIGIQAKDGTELLIHIGLETVTLKGEGFRCLVQEGELISVGEPLIEADWAFLKEHAANIVTPIVITNGQSKKIEVFNMNECKAGETVLMTVSS